MKWAHFNDMVWPVPCEDLRTLNWSLRYAPKTLTKSELILAASLISAYISLVSGERSGSHWSKTKKDVWEIIKNIRQREEEGNNDELATDRDGS